MTQTMPVPLRSDADLQRSVQRELRWDARVDASHIGVQVMLGVVTLTGAVDSYAEKLAAQEAAHQVAGVLDVANDIQVRVPRAPLRTDTDIALAVRRALEWDVLVPHEQIRTTVEAGHVTLEGEVPLWSHRTYAENAIRHLAGVRGVTNNLTIVPSPIDPEEIRHAIEEALERRAEREASRITVQVHNGAVHLVGRVRSWAERRAVLGAAGHAPGVHTVADDLRIDPDL